MDSAQYISSLFYEFYIMCSLQENPQIMENPMEFLLQQASFVKVPVATLSFIYLLYAFQVFNLWQERIAGTRLRQSLPDCPSHKLPPDAKRWDEHKGKTLLNSSRHEVFSKCKLLERLRNTADTSQYASSHRRKLAESLSKVKSLSSEKAKALDMDHLYLSFLQFLWAYTFVGPCANILKLKGEISLRTRRFLVKH